MKLLAILVIVIYSLAMASIVLYSIIQFSLALSYKKRAAQKAPSLDEFPKVLIQLPIYNEQYVVERLLNQILQIDYPKDKLKIQILDDSDDETSRIIENYLQSKPDNGFDLIHLKRSDRKGFKAGALAYGLEKSNEEFVAIFDADFLPKPDFLIKTLGYFQNEEVGVVQTRWEHINRDYNLLTKLQAFVLDAHFTVEQGGRANAGYFLNFNGTAGIWRRAAIVQAGGWSNDTLTEDLDLSYRAQLKAWKIVFAEEVGSPAELPIEMNALRTQQFRWNKGAAENTLLNLPKVFRKPNMGLGRKLHAAAHLMNSFLFLCVLGIGLLCVPMVWALNSFGELSSLYKFGGVFLIGMVFLFFFYQLAFKRIHPDSNRLEFVRRFVLFLAFSLGLSLHNALAVMEAYLGLKTPFLRTPKFNVNNENQSYLDNKYVLRKVPFVAFLELLLLGYFMFGIYLSIILNQFGQTPFLILLVMGYAGIAYYSFAPSKRIRRATESQVFVSS